MKKMNKLSNIRKKTNVLMFALSIACLVLALVVALIYLAAYNGEEHTVEATGSTGANFRVFYVENDLFPSNPVPNNLQFLKSFTDFIEIDNHFSAQFSEEVEVHYTYRSTKRMVVNHMTTGEGGQNPVVYEVTYPQSQSQGSMITNRIDFSGNTEGPGSTYTVSSEDFIDYYLEFIHAQELQMSNENIFTRNLRGFSADLFIDFTYTINIPEWNINETVSTGYRIPLTEEAYFVILNNGEGATNSFESSLTLSSPPPQVTLPMVIIFMLLIALGLFGLLDGIKKLTADQNKYRQEASVILKKYANEIAHSFDRIPLSQYTIMRAESFDTLLKLSINLNKHIMCFKDDDYVEFAVLVEEFAYYYRIDYNVSEDGEVADNRYYVVSNDDLEGEPEYEIIRDEEIRRKAWH